WKQCSQSSRIVADGGALQGVGQIGVTECAGGQRLENEVDAMLFGQMPAESSDVSNLNHILERQPSRQRETGRKDSRNAVRVTILGCDARAVARDSAVSARSLRHRVKARKVAQRDVVIRRAPTVSVNAQCIWRQGQNTVLIVALHAVVEDARAAAKHRLAVAENVPRDIKAWGELHPGSTTINTIGYLAPAREQDSVRPTQVWLAVSAQAVRPLAADVG